MSQLILVRHGQSTWNAANRFTGWVDVALTEKGREEAAEGARRLAAEGVHVDRAYTSQLQRAVLTGEIVLDGLGQGGLEQVRAWELNERFYGALTGRNKDEARAKFGADQVHAWRRGYATRPPAGESLEDTAKRCLPYFADEIIPATLELDVVLVSAHGNSLRAIVKELEGLADDEIPQVEIPTGIPYVYEMADGAMQSKRALD